jgi:lipopolysaccharide/colanic/teichoic acid biosynthesis glycosyltransferase
LIGAEEKRVLDDFYVENASLKLDFVIVLRTIQTVLFGDTSRLLIDRKAVNAPI